MVSGASITTQIERLHITRESHRGLATTGGSVPADRRSERRACKATGYQLRLIPAGSDSPT